MSDSAIALDPLRFYDAAVKIMDNDLGVDAARERFGVVGFSGLELDAAMYRFGALSKVLVDSDFNLPPFVRPGARPFVEAALICAAATAPLRNGGFVVDELLAQAKEFCQPEGKQ